MSQRTVVDVVLECVPDSEMLLLLEQVGTQCCCRRLSTWGWVGEGSAEVVGPGLETVGVS